MLHIHSDRLQTIRMYSIDHPKLFSWNDEIGLISVSSIGVGSLRLLPRGADDFLFIADLVPPPTISGFVHASYGNFSLAYSCSLANERTGVCVLRIPMQRAAVIFETNTRIIDIAFSAHDHLWWIEVVRAVFGSYALLTYSLES